MVIQRSENNEDLIDIISIFRTLWAEKITIVMISGLVVLMSAIYAISLPNIYKSSTLITANNQNTSMSSRMMGSQLGGLASLAGISIPGGAGEDKSIIAIETMKSQKFFADYIYDKIIVELMATKEWIQKDNELVIDAEIYNTSKNIWVRNVASPLSKKPSIQEAHNAFMRIFDLEEKDPPFYEISVVHQSPFIAMQWNKLIMESINNAMRIYDVSSSEKSIKFLMEELKKNNQVVLNDVFASLIEQQTQQMMLANVNEEYVLRTIDPAIASELRESPKRKIIVILGLIFGFLLSLLFIFVKNYRKHAFFI